MRLSQSSSAAPTAWHLRQARRLREARARQRASAKPTPWGREGGTRASGRRSGTPGRSPRGGRRRSCGCCAWPATNGSRARGGDDLAGGVARPARRVKALHAGAGAERVLHLLPGNAARGIGRHARALVAADAEGLVAVARRAVGCVAARVDAVQRDVVRRMDVERADHAVVAVEALAAAVAAQAVALVAPGRLVIGAEGRGVRVEAAQRSRRHQQPGAAGRDRAARRQVHLEPAVGQREVAGAAARGRLLLGARCGTRGRAPSSADRRAWPAPRSRGRGRARSRCRGWRVAGG